MPTYEAAIGKIPSGARIGGLSSYRKHWNNDGRVSTDSVNNNEIRVAPVSLTDRTVRSTDKYVMRGSPPAAIQHFQSPPFYRINNLETLNQFTHGRIR